MSLEQCIKVRAMLRNPGEFKIGRIRPEYDQAFFGVKRGDVVLFKPTTSNVDLLIVEYPMDDERIEQQKTGDLLTTSCCVGVKREYVEELFQNIIFMNKDEHYTDVKQAVCDFIDCADGNVERLARIEDLLHVLNFEKRLALLTEEETKHMLNAAVGTELTEEGSAKLNACKTEREREALLKEFTRSNYFLQCAWSNFLNGECEDKPFTSKPRPVLKHFQTFDSCRTCVHQADSHDMNCIECCPER